MSSKFQGSLPENQTQTLGQGQPQEHGYEHAPGQEQGQGQWTENGQGHGPNHWQGHGQGMPYDAQSMNSTSSSQTLVQLLNEINKVYLTLEQMEELPSVPYKLRHALTADEWERRMQVISKWTEKSSHPGYELVYFFILCILIPGGIAYPMFRVLLAKHGKIPWGYAMIISSSISFGLFLLFFTPMLVRKWILQRRMNKDAERWAQGDIRKLPEKDQSFKVQWRVRLPWIFNHGCHITIPIPPRSDEGSVLLSRHESNPSEAAAWAGVPRGDSNTNRSMFENA